MTNDARSGPPSLQRSLMMRLRMLLLINLPLIIGSACAALWLYTTDGVRVSFAASDGLLRAIVILVCTIVVMVSTWLLLPLARWLRGYPAWHFRHTSRMLWALPAFGGLLLWFVLICVCIGMLLLLGFVIAASL